MAFIVAFLVFLSLVVFNARGDSLSFKNIVSSVAAGAGVWLVLTLAAAAGFSLMVVAPLVVLAMLLAAVVSARETDDTHRRGGKLVDTSTLKKMSLKEDPQAEIFLGGVGVPRDKENRHFLLAGATGAGKSQAFYAIVQAARARGDGGVVADINAELLSRVYDSARDVILNPIDTRSATWSPLAEIAGEWDADRVAKSIVPEGVGDSKEWNHYAQQILSALLFKVWSANGTNRDLLQLVLRSGNDEFSQALAGTNAAQFTGAGAERMLGSIRAILSSFCSFLPYLPPRAGRDAFSITRFVQEEAREKRGAWMFLPVRDDFFKFFRSLVAAEVDIAISALLSADDDETRRVWFFVDEFASWGKISSVDALLTKARKKGGVGVLGVQTIAQLREAYGREGAQTLLANLGTWLTLRAGDAETADFMSKNLGDEEIRRVNQTSGTSGKSRAEQIATQRVVMPADLQNLPDLVGVLNVAGPLPAGWVRVEISRLKRTVEGFQIPAAGGGMVGQSADTGEPGPGMVEPVDESDDGDLVGELLEIGDEDPKTTPETASVSQEGEGEK